MGCFFLLYSTNRLNVFLLGEGCIFLHKGEGCVCTGVLALRRQGQNEENRQVLPMRSVHFFIVRTANRPDIVFLCYILTMFM